MKDVLIVVDMQNDFITGSLGSEQAKAVVPAVCDLIKQFDKKGNRIILTRDTHDKKYLKTLEGKVLPIVHCVKDSEGWQVCNEVATTLVSSEAHVEYIDKITFGSTPLAQLMRRDYDDELGVNIHVCGLDTDICVAANAIMLRAFLPNTRIIVHASACAGSSEEAHKAAIVVMRSNQIEVED